MNYKTETVEVKGSQVAFVTIQTNEQNSFTRDNLLEFEALMEELKMNGEIRAVVITSENEKFFSNGVDARNIIATPRERLAEEMGQIVRFFDYLATWEKPLIAEVGGYAMGGGAVVAMGCDYVYMLAGKGRMSFTEVFFGIPLPGSVVEKTKMRARPHAINDIIYGGVFKAPEAHAAGLVHEIAEDRDALRKLVIKKLEKILQVPTSAFAATKRALHRQLVASIDEHARDLTASFDDPVIMGNLLEAMSALKEKRRPKFQ